MLYCVVVIVVFSRLCITQHSAFIWLRLVVCCTPHRTEEFFSNVPFVVSLPAHFTIEPDFILITCEAPEHLLLHTTLGAVNIIIRATVFTALWEALLCAHAFCNSITNPWVFFSLEAEKELLGLLRVFVLFIALFNSLGCFRYVELCMSFR